MATLKFVDGTREATFSGPTTGITISYDDQQAELELRSRAQVAVYTNYTAGDETSVQLVLEMSPVVDYPVTATPTGTDYYFFSEVDATANLFRTELTVVAGKLRLPIPLLHQERMLRLSVKRTGGSDGGAGSITLKVVDDSHPVTTAFAGVQP